MSEGSLAVVGRWLRRTGLLRRGEAAAPDAKAGELAFLLAKARLTGKPVCREVLQRWFAKQAAAPWMSMPTCVQQLLPVVGLEDIAELQRSLGHAFKNPMLLAQALTHPSKVGALTPCYQRLASVGEAVAEFCVTQCLVLPSQSHTDVNHAASAISMGGFVAELVLPAGSRAQSRKLGGRGGGRSSEQGGCSDIGRDPEEGRWFDLPLEAQRRKEAYCNHALYARTCVLLRLHLSLQHDADDLGRSVQSFADSVMEGGSSRQMLRFLVSRGAPRALGDCFLACVGAVALDWEGMDHACSLVKSHLRLSAGAPAALQTPLGLMLKECKSCSAAEVARSMSGLQECVRVSSLAPPPPPVSASPLRAAMSSGQSSQFSVLDALCDMHVVEDLHGVLLGATSPRSACLRAAVLLHPDPGNDVFADQPEPEPVKSPTKEEQDDNGSSDVHEPPSQPEGSRGSEQYCAACNKWLNGPTQLLDHKIGKKHKKNVKQGNPAAQIVKKRVPSVEKSGQVGEASCF